MLVGADLRPLLRGSWQNSLECNPYVIVPYAPSRKVGWLTANRTSCSVRIVIRQKQEWKRRRAT